MPESDAHANTGSAAFLGAEPGGVAPAGRPLRGYRDIALYGFFVAALLYGIAEARGAPLARVVAAVAAASAATMWCIVDASMRGDYFPHSFRWFTMITWQIAVPVYLFRSRKWQEALWRVIVAGALLGAGKVLGSTLVELFG